MSIKKLAWVFGALTVLLSCGKEGDGGTVRNPIRISSPTPEKFIDKVTLDDTQKACVKAGNEFAFRCLKMLYAADITGGAPVSHYSRRSAFLLPS